MKKNLFFLLASFLFSFFILSCSEEENTTGPPAPACDQACQDEHVAYGLIDIFWFIWNQNIAGQPAGNKDFTVPGPQGGTVHVTGTTEVATNGINTLHLTFEMNNCKGIKEKYNLAFNGEFTADGTFSVTHRAITYNSQQLGFNGSVGKDNWVTNVNGFCEMIINQTFTSVSGTICGRTFSY
jgi:hypothetical protein